MRFQPRWFGEPIKSEYLTDRLGANSVGVLAEYAVFNEEAVVALPSHLSFEGAAFHRQSDELVEASLLTAKPRYVATASA